MATNRNRQRPISSRRPEGRASGGHIIRMLTPEEQEERRTELRAVEAVAFGRLTAEVHQEVCCCRCHKAPGRMVSYSPPVAPERRDADEQTPDLAVTIQRPAQRRRRRRDSSPEQDDRDPRRRISVTFNDE